MSFLRKKFSYSYFYVTFIMVAINVAVFLLAQRSNIASLFSLNLYSVIDRWQLWRLVTYMFTQYNFSHLFWNMFGILMFGVTVEKAVGSKEFLMFYLVTGILGGLFSLIVYALSGNPFVNLIGASGVLYAILFAYAVIFPKSRIFIRGIIPVRAPILVLIYAVIEFVTSFDYGSHIAHYTHLFGFVAAGLYFVIRFGVHPFKVWKRSLKDSDNQ